MCFIFLVDSSHDMSILIFSKNILECHLLHKTKKKKKKKNRMSSATISSDTLRLSQLEKRCI